MKAGVVAVLFCARLVAVQIPSGTELNIRLTDKVASEATPDPTASHAAIHAVLVSPVAVDGQMALPLGAQLTGVVTSAKAAADGVRATLLITFNQIGLGTYHTKLAALVSGLDNARESVGADGVITGIDGTETFSSRIDQGVEKLKANDRFAALAGIIQTAKEALKIQPANANVDYDPGVELTVKLTAPLDWRGPTAGPEAKLVPLPNEAGLIDLVDREPFRTVAENPPRPSDVTNIMLLGTEAEIREAFAKAGWSSAARLTTQSKLETARALIEDRGYKEGPMSVLLLDGQAPAFSYQKGNNTFAARHHLRIFRRPETFAGKPVWVVSSTHDTGIDFSERDRTFIHRIDSNIDNERAKVVNDLLFTGAIRSLALVDRPDVGGSTNGALTNATGDQITTDGRMAVLLFQ